MGKISRYKVQVDGITYRVSVEDESSEVTEVQRVSPETPEASDAEQPQVARERIEVRTHLPGNVFDVTCQPGDEVQQGDTLMLIEAMKMQSPVYAPTSGVVESVEVKKGDVVKSGQLLAYLI
ncbi:MAG: biotin/lipoyl-containing protein [Desulfobulbus sp.]